ncbi:MAG TPA: peptidoglycan DD-metalloendopeptidase family protein [Steroidobacteraceae bacterium]
MRLNAARRARLVCAAALITSYCAGGWAAAPAQPRDSAQANSKLAAVRARIAALTNRLGDELKQRDALSARLREADLAITTQRQRVDSLRIEQAAVERHRTELRSEQQDAQAALREQRAALAAQVRAAYMIGRQEQLKLLLNQSNPASLGRTLTYYGYFAEARSAKIESIQAQMSRLQQLVLEIDEQSAQLLALQDAAAREMANLAHARAERADALAALSKQVLSGNQELADLKREEQAVESLVAELARVMQDFPVDPSQSFDAMRGKLPWPVPGRVTARYQEQHGNSAPGVRWNGEMIEAARGAKVRAPYFGRVVYADWLQGLGLLLIIGHSGGYMTLYGHAEVLYKSVGDWVAPGDVIAALSDANAAPQLYFEIREGRKTVDPKAWLRTNP